jgi:mRNA deadenylase 3'-5' endonuclease subunit Ccr4
MLQPGKMQEVAQEMIRYKTDIMVLQEMRWQGSRRMDKPEFTIIYSGSKKRTGQRKKKKKGRMRKQKK